MRSILVAALLTVFAAALPAASTLEIYAIDVEGGKATLVVSPSGQSMLIDLGWPAVSNNAPASADRILKAVRAAGVKQIDFLLITHYDIDHIGNVAAVAAGIPVKHILDHGEFAPSDAMSQGYRKTLTDLYARYTAAREPIPHTTLKAGDRIPLRGVDVRVVSAAGTAIHAPLAGGGAANPLCADARQPDARPGDKEDDESVALFYTFGKFRMFDPSDLEAHLTHALACPVNLLGTVGVYQLNVHGQFKGAAPAAIGALRAKAIVEANGARKGGDAETWPVLRAAPGQPDIWQVHYSDNAGADRNPPPDFLANLQGNEGSHGIRISAREDGSFTITNERNGFSKSYPR